MSWLRDKRLYSALLVATLLLPLGLFFYLVFSVLGMRASYEAQIDQLAPRIARMQGLIERQDVLADSTQRIDSEVASLVYPGSDDRAAVSASLQKLVREILSDAEMKVINSQILSVIEDQGFDRISVSLAATGELAALDLALSDIAALRPLVMVEVLNVKPQSVRSGDKGSPQKISVSMQVFSLRQSL
ncbi:hypothetical protein H2508_14245 [Parahaliea sp. F7430]|uniref:General secretion pathway protein M n=1 Tax=Sediminihaliea albiluteola TaxID=2758564 RepID=A0A7W2TYI8_9GAMM|nr:type II secretion system protein GspM [Sediminihaliea albiluteola]MBA6414272.1 hypothetical protein [Sediminihaliea albiluteola]